MVQVWFASVFAHSDIMIPFSHFISAPFDPTPYLPHGHQALLGPDPEDLVAQAPDHQAGDKLTEPALHCTELGPVGLDNFIPTFWNPNSFRNNIYPKIIILALRSVQICNSYLSRAYSLALVNVSSSKKSFSSGGTVVEVLILTIILQQTPSQAFTCTQPSASCLCIPPRGTQPTWRQAPTRRSCRAPPPSWPLWNNKSHSNIISSKGPT